MKFPSSTIIYNFFNYFTVLVIYLSSKQKEKKKSLLKWIFFIVTSLSFDWFFFAFPSYFSLLFYFQCFIVYFTYFLFFSLYLHFLFTTHSIHCFKKNSNNKVSFQHYCTFTVSPFQFIIVFFIMKGPNFSALFSGLLDICWFCGFLSLFRELSSFLVFSLKIQKQYFLSILSPG